jgi:hypothetical protein
MTTTREPYCLGRTGGRNWTQEMYETASRDARTRAAQLRKLGYRVSVSALGPQVTPVGRVTMTMLTIDTTPAATETPPWPAQLARYA